LWRIPAERMKMRFPHIVPLSRQAIAVLEALQELSGHSPLLFPGERNVTRSMSNNTLLFALYRMGYHSRMTGHGFRGIASTILHEKQYPDKHIELQLAHLVGNEVSRAYDYAEHLKPRARMMQHWADYLDEIKETGKCQTYSNYR